MTTNPNTPNETRQEHWHSIDGQTTFTVYAPDTISNTEHVRVAYTTWTQILQRLHFHQITTDQQPPTQASTPKRGHVAP